MFTPARRRRTPPATGPVAAVLACALVALACGSGSSAVPAATPAPVATVTAVATQTPAPVPTTPATAAPPATPTTAPASLEPGSITFRVVNLTAAPVDVWLRSQGLVLAQPGVLALVPNAVTDDLLPPEPGAVVVLPAGEGRPTCVVDCGFLAETTTGFGKGDRRLLVVREGAASEFWEHPDAASVGAMANALPPADPTGGLFIAEAGAVTDASFGLRVALAGAGTCLADTTGGTNLLGGTVVLAYPVGAGDVSVVVHGSADTACIKPPVAGPFTGTVAKGGRTMLVLAGSMASMRAIPVALP